MHDRVGLERDRRLDPGRRRVDDRDTGEHVRGVDPVAERGGGGGELDARVDALRLVGVGRDVDDDAVAGIDEVAHGVGQVQLALCVDGLQPVERRPEQIGPEDVDRRVRLADRELLRRRVARLDDRLEVAVGAADDPPVAADVGGDEREDGRARGPRPVRLDQGLEELGRQERRVAGEDQHLVGAGERRLARSGPRPRCRAAAPARRSSSPRSRSAVSGDDDDDERLGVERPGRLDDPVDHPPPEDRVQVLRRRRAHACPTASGHDDGCELGAGFGHGRHVGWGARIRTWDHGTKTRCLTTWPRPSESGRRVYPDTRSHRAGRVSAGRGGALPATTAARTTTHGEHEHADRARCRRGRGRRSAGRRLRPTWRRAPRRRRGCGRPTRRPRRTRSPAATPTHQGIEAGEDEHRLDHRDGDGDLRLATAQPAREAGSRDARRRDRIMTRTVDARERAATPPPGRAQRGEVTQVRPVPAAAPGCRASARRRSAKRP